MSSRKKVLQVDEKALRGLVGQYGDSDSDGEQGGDDVAPPEPDKPPVNGQGIKNQELDSQVADFLAEIEAIEPPASEMVENEEAEAAPTVGKGKAVMLGGMKFVSGGTTKQSQRNGQTEQAVPTVKLLPPTEPHTFWQHCYDESTQHYYYWNTQTNEVTWEIPDGYSQYLLKYKAYEEALAIYEAEKGKVDKRNTGEQKMVGPSAVQATPTSATCSTGVTMDIPVDLMLGPPPPPPAEEEPAVVGPTLPDNMPTVTEEPAFIGPLKPDKSDDQAEPEKSQDSQREIGPQLPQIGPQLPTKSDAPVVDEPEGRQQVKSTDDIDDEEIYQELEEPIFSEYKQKKSRREVVRPSVPPGKSSRKTLEEDDEEFDIDQQLDMALEKTTKKTPKKRKKPSDEAEDTPNTRLSKLSAADTPGADEEAVSYIKKKLLKNKEQLKLKTEIADLATLVTDKLEFLEITRKGLSKLQVLLIEIQTRIHDWRNGGLETKYLQGKLKEASKQLEQYETSAAPPSWTCHWDRMYKRYFYSHKVTGESRWDYPDDEDESDEAPEILERSRSSSGASTPPQDMQELGTEDMEVDGNPMSDTDPPPADNVDGQPLVDYPADEPPPPGTGPQVPLPDQIPPPLPPERYSASDSPASGDDESPEPPTAPEPGEQPEVVDTATLSAPPVLRHVEPFSASVSEEGKPQDECHTTEAVISTGGTSTPLSGSPQHHSPAQEGSGDDGEASTHRHHKKKKKHHHKSKKSSSSLSNKKRNFPSMVQKWQHAQEDMEKEYKKRKQVEREAEEYAERMVEKWKQEEREKVDKT